MTKNEQTFLNLCKKYEQDILLLIEKKIFDFKNGKAIIHRDEKGVARKIEVDNVVYKV